MFWRVIWPQNRYPFRGIRAFASAEHRRAPPRRVRHASLHWLVSVVQCLQECDDVGFVLCRHCRRFAEMPVEGRIAHIDVSLILYRNVVEFLDRPVSRTRIDFLRVSVAEIVEIEHLLQRLEYPVVEERAAYGGVAQGWRLEHAAKLHLVGKVGANRSTNP